MLGVLFSLYTPYPYTMYIVILINFWAARTLGHEPVVSFRFEVLSSLYALCKYIMFIHHICVLCMIDFSQLLGVTNFAFQQPTL